MNPAQTSARYQSFLKHIGNYIPANRVISDPIRTLAYGTDASFYRLIPKIVVKTESEAEVVALLNIAHQNRVPVTFRAAGTSLSGQAITDSILVVAGNGWKLCSILENGSKIRLQPGVIGAKANAYLAPYGRKIGPDPASINSAMIGGIAANNASGMCCGIAQNSYQTVESMRIIFEDGTLLDTSDADSRKAFSMSHSHLLEKISALGAQVAIDKELSARIRHKFKIKNTTGYSLNALVEYKDPFDIITHLMIGSEGTLGFISEIVYQTVVDHVHKASALMVFANIEDACRTVYFLKNAPVQAVELMDRAALRSVENKKGIPGYLKDLPMEATALLVETRASNDDALQLNVAAIIQTLDGIPLTATDDRRTFSQLTRFKPMKCAATLLPVQFTDAVKDYTQLWNIRKGLFPSVGAVRQVGTTAIIEDVAFPLKHLAAATSELQTLFRKHQYSEAIIFGHALEGNLHFVFTQDFADTAEVERYRRFMDDVCHMVVDRYDGSLKAEHGTGRNMAPFVEMEWGATAYQLMKAIKQIFDPYCLLNPGVILSDDTKTHVKNLKPLPPAHSILDKCIECGFCEVNCPSKNLTLTPRQRIVIQREIARLKVTCENPERLKEFEAGYLYVGEQTCAADGLCATSCPVGINTGDHTKHLRSLQVSTRLHKITADWIASHYPLVTQAMRWGLKLTHLGHRFLGTSRMLKIARIARKLSNNHIPAWNPFMPQGIYGPHVNAFKATSSLKVVYFPSCINMAMGPAMGDPDQEPLYQVIKRVLERAGFGVIFPPRGNNFCCGTPFESKGYINQADQLSRELETILLSVSESGRLPILCDTGPCVYRMRQTMDSRLKIYEPMGFILDYLLDKLQITPVKDTIAIHITCSSRKMELGSVFHEVARVLSSDAIFPEEVSCCGWAGDRGFNFPELTASALKELKPSVQGRCTAGYTNSRTCEIGLSQHSGIYYKSIFYLLDQCSR
ncbi:MAG: FAD-binding and (Fe-S)-binding domain-containing protein [Pseudomonadota bacterium]